MNLVEINVVGPEAFERSLNGLHEMPPRGANVVPARASAAVSLGGDHNVFARQAEIGDRLRENLFRLAVRVDIRSVDEVDTRIQGEPEQLVGEFLLHSGNRLPDTVAGGEGHRAQTKFRDKQAGVAQ